MKYQVSLPGRPPGTVAASARAMADAFGISESKATALLERTPGPLTKAINEREAVRVAYKLRKLGLAVEVTPVRTEGEVESASGATQAPPPKAPASAAGSASGTPRSPFLSQVDEAPRPIAGLQETPGPASGAAAEEPPRSLDVAGPEGDRKRASAGDPRSSGERPDPAARARAGLGANARTPTPYAPTGVGALPRQGEVASPFRRRLVLAALLPGLVALAAAWFAFALIDGGIDDATLAGVAASHAEGFGVMLGGRDPAGIGARGELREALLGARSALEVRGVTAVAVTNAEGDVLAGWPTDLGAIGAGPDAAGWAALVARADRSSEAVFGAVGEQGWRAVATPIRVRGNPVAVTLVLGEPGPPLGRFGLALTIGALALLVAGLVARWSNRAWLRDHDRLLEETVRISRGDLGRPVEPSTHFPEAVQALERIRVSLLEGLERLRRRKR